MKKIIIIPIILLLIAGGIFYFKANKIVSSLNNYGVESSLISPTLAEFVASEYLPKYYPGNYVNVGHFTFYNLDGKPARYTFIYRKSGYELDTLGKIEDFARGITSQNRENFYSNIFTVVTGANDINSLIDRVYRGLPEIIMEKEKLKNKIGIDYVDKEIKLGRLIFLGTTDIRYELVSIGNNIKEEQIVGESSYLINKKGELEKVSNVREAIERKELRRSGEEAELSETELLNENQRMTESLNSNITKWKEFEEKLQPK